MSSISISYVNCINDITSSGSFSTSDVASCASRCSSSSATVNTVGFAYSNTTSSSRCLCFTPADSTRLSNANVVPRERCSSMCPGGAPSPCGNLSELDYAIYQVNRDSPPATTLSPPSSSSPSPSNTIVESSPSPSRIPPPSLVTSIRPSLPTPTSFENDSDLVNTNRTGRFFSVAAVDIAPVTTTITRKLIQPTSTSDDTNFSGNGQTITRQFNGGFLIPGTVSPTNNEGSNNSGINNENPVGENDGYQVSNDGFRYSTGFYVTLVMGGLLLIGIAFSLYRIYENESNEKSKTARNSHATPISKSDSCSAALRGKRQSRESLTLTRMLNERGVSVIDSENDTEVDIMVETGTPIYYPTEGYATPPPLSLLPESYVQQSTNPFQDDHSQQHITQVLQASSSREPLFVHNAAYSSQLPLQLKDLPLPPFLYQRSSLSSKNSVHQASQSEVSNSYEACSSDDEC